MKRRILAVLVLAALLLAMFTACGEKSGFVTAEQAQKIALEDAGLKASQASDVHTHGGAMEDGTPIYSVHITVGDQEYEYVILASTGEILSSNMD